MNESLVDYVPSIIRYAITIATVSLPFLLWGKFFETFVAYKRRVFWNKQNPVVLEILLPKEVTKTPSAMEAFLLNLNQTGGEGTWYDRNFLGKTRPYFSLELASIEGKVRFFIWTWTGWKKFTETQLYAQYPGIEVTEVKDYTKKINYNPSEYGLWGCEIELSKADAFPIKTYRDFGIGEEKLLEEEFKVDPITPTIEFLGSVGQRQQVWIQFIVRGHKDEDLIPFSLRWGKFKKTLLEKGYNDAWKELWKKKDNWKDSAAEEIKKIKEETVQVIKDKDGKEQKVFPNVSKGQSEVINALERSVSKPAYDVGIRAMYISENEFFDASNIGGLTSIFKQYGSHNLNGFKPKNATSFDYPWQDIFGKKLLKKKQELFEVYRARDYFYEPNKEKHMVLNSEELATVYHFPGQVVQTPSFDRVLSKKAEPPGNLPV